MEKMNDNVQSRGSFRTVNNLQSLCGTFLAAGLIMIALVVIGCIFDFGDEINPIVTSMFFVCLGLEVTAAVVWFVAGFRGEHKYEIRDTEFSVTAPNGSEEIFYYSDVKAVEYTAFKKGKNRGYIVKITTGIRSVKYQFVFGVNAEKFDTSATPFFELEVNAGLREPMPVVEVDKDAIMEQFEQMSRDQKMGKAKGEDREKLLMDEIINTAAKSDEKKE
ncbi:MAG: hypothetical protein E7485_02365 [Ruminococcaceae bacterium]|nr:hypothetical protein [Oscillospiraceae bacterium]